MKSVTADSSEMTPQSPSASAVGGRWKIWFRAAAGAVLVGYLVLHTRWAPVAVAIRGLTWSHWLAALALNLLSQVASAWRWSELARPLGFALSRLRFLRLYFAGMFFSLCLPSSIGGDVLKVYWLAPTTGGRLLAGCTVLADRFAGVMALGIIGLTTLLGRSYGLSFPSMLAIGLVLVIATQASASLGLRLLGPLRDRLSTNNRWGQFAEKLLPYRDRPEVIRRSLGWGLAVQLLNVFTVVEIGRAMGLNLPTAAYCLAVPAVALLAILPVSISGVGVREGGMAWMLASYGVSEELGVTLGLLWFLVTIVSGLIGAVVYLFGVRSSEQVTAQLAEGSHPALTPAVSSASADKPTVAKNFGLKVFHADSAIEEDQPLNESPSPRILPLTRAAIAGWRLSVVVPVYDEVENLDPLVQALRCALDALDQPYEIIFINDGSTDGSTERLDEIAADDERVKAIHLRRNYGQTAALDAGIHLATGDVIITLDADLQNDPADIPALLEKLAEGYDLVHGWRKQRQDKFITRRVPSLVANWLISRVTGFAVHDLGCTLKAIRRETAHELHLYGEMHRFIPILAHWGGARCAEIVTRHHPRQAGKSKYGLSRTIRVLFDLVTVKYMVQYLTSPMKLFGTFGMAAGFVGLISATVTFGMWLDGFHLSRNPLLLLSIFAGFVSLQFFVLGLLGELGVRTYYESQGKRPYGIRRMVNCDEPRSAPDQAPQARSADRRSA